jgi:hypothetical protein
MKAGKTLAVAVVWSASLIGVGLWAQGGGQRVTPAPVIQSGQPVGPIITGENIGFQRLAAHPDRDGKITGVFKIRIDGEWFETTSPVRVVRSR